MEILRAQVVAANCGECRDRLLLECRDFGLPLPEGEFVVPKRWAFEQCPHVPDGLVLRFEPQADLKVSIDRLKDGEEEIEAPEHWTNLDASKDIGYPARETGRYGSYPSHDGFGDESDL